MCLDAQDCQQLLMRKAKDRPVMKWQYCGPKGTLADCIAYQRQGPSYARLASMSDSRLRSMMYKDSTGSWPQTLTGSPSLLKLSHQAL